MKYVNITYRTEVSYIDVWIYVVIHKMTSISITLITISIALGLTLACITVYIAVSRHDKTGRSSSIPVPTPSLEPKSPSGTHSSNRTKFPHVPPRHYPIPSLPPVPSQCEFSFDKPISTDKGSLALRYAAVTKNTEPENASFYAPQFLGYTTVFDQPNSYCEKNAIGIFTGTPEDQSWCISKNSDGSFNLAQNGSITRVDGKTPIEGQIYKNLRVIKDGIYVSEASKILGTTPPRYGMVAIYKRDCPFTI